MGAVEQMVHDDFVVDMPQSGERARGFAAFKEQFDAYPGGTPDMPLVDEIELLTDEPRFAMAPSFRVVPLSSGNEFTAVVQSRYPDGTKWFSIVLVELRDEKLYRLENYFAPEMPAPLAESIAAVGRR